MMRSESDEGKQEQAAPPEVSEQNSAVSGAPTEQKNAVLMDSAAVVQETQANTTTEARPATRQK